MFELEPIEKVVRVAAAGGGFQMDASNIPTDDLVRIAVAATAKRAQITFTGPYLRPIEELVQIAGAGQGCVIFADE